MTERWILYLKYLQQNDVITQTAIMLSVGTISLGFILRYSPFKFAQKLSGIPYWSFITGLFMIVLIGLVILQYKIG